MDSHIHSDLRIQWPLQVSLEVRRKQPGAALTSLHCWSPDISSPASSMGESRMGGMWGGGYNNEGEARAWTRGGEGRVWTGKGGGGLLTLCLNSDFSSRVMVSALAMTGTMFTTLLRCFMNSRSRGRKLGPREGRVSEPPCPTPLSHCHRSRWDFCLQGVAVDCRPHPHSLVS